MSKNEFDDLLRKKITEEELDYNPENWKRLSQLLPPALPDRSKKWTIGLGIAAALALLLATTLLVKLMDQNSQMNASGRNLAANRQHEQNIINESPGKSNASEIGNEAPGKEIIQGKSGSSDKNHWAVARKQGDQAGISDPGNRENQNGAMKKQITTGQIETTVVAPGQQMPENGVTDENDEREARTGPSPALLPGQLSLHRQQKNMLAIESYNPHPLKGGSQTSIAVGGGVNYGSLNAGYSLGVTAQQKIGNHFFFDGTVAIMYNNNTPNNIVDYAGAPTPTNTAARPAQKLMLSTPAVAPVASLYYIQFNPSFGYQLVDNLAISVGGDLQQMLSQDNEFRKYQVSEEGTRVFPGLDLGFTGKTEYSITPQIQAGIIFREGLNNLIKPNQELPFVNRRYIQVQFKYNIPVSR